MFQAAPLRHCNNPIIVMLIHTGFFNPLIIIAIQRKKAILFCAEWLKNVRSYCAEMISTSPAFSVRRPAVECSTYLA